RRALHRIRERLTTTAEQALGVPIRSTGAPALGAAAELGATPISAVPALGAPDTTTATPAPAYPGPQALLDDLDAIDASLRDSGDGLLADGRLAALRHAVETFGFHLQ